MNNNNNDTFIRLYNQLDIEFSKILNIEYIGPNIDYQGYSNKIYDIKHGKSPVKGYVVAHFDRLKRIGYIRNKLIHEYKDHVQVSDFTIDEINKHIKSIKHPKRSYDIFKRDVYKCRENDLLRDVILTMKAHNYTHIPVVNEQDNFKGIISESSIIYFIGEKFETDGGVLDNVRIKDIDLNYGNDEYKFISHKTTVYEVEDFFLNAINLNKRLGVIFITNHGKSDEHIDGVITAWELPKIQY